MYKLQSIRQAFVATLPRNEYSIDEPLIIIRPHVPRQPHCVARDVSLHIAIAQKRKPILISVLHVVVLKPRILHCLQEMDCLDVVR